MNGIELTSIYPLHVVVCTGYELNDIDKYSRKVVAE